MKPNLMLDSGAFTAFTQNKVVNLNEYCEFAKKYQQYIHKVINLDVINPQDPEVAAEAGYNNFLDMRGKYIDCVPVFHAREHTRWLDKMLKITNYVGLSGTSLVSPKENRIWHDLVWDYVTDNDGKTIADFHAFGDTAERSLLTYPWYSCDSATWMIQAGRAGRIKLQGKSFQLRSLTIGDNNYISSDDKGPKKQEWERECRELGMNPEAVLSVKAKGSQLAMIRSYLVAADLLRLADRTKSITSLKRGPSLLNTKKQLTGGHERLGGVKIYFVISPSAYNFNFPILAALNISNILVSYYYVVTAPKGFWEEKMLPYLEDPIKFCQTEEKTKPFWEKLHECLLSPVEV